MTLTVRLDPTLESSLERYCAATGATKSLVVQESLAAYLLAHAAPAPQAAAGGTAAPSANFRAFADAGLVGCVALGQGADKAAVRARVSAAMARRRPAAPGA